jgi:hypothetical protein
MFFTVSEEIATSMVENPHDWVQGMYEFTNTKHRDLSLWTYNGATFLKIGGNDCLSLAEKFYLSRAIKKSIARRLMTPNVRAHRRARVIVDRGALLLARPRGARG